MPTVNFDELRQYIAISKSAEKLLSKSEKEITFSLNLYKGEDQILEASTYVVYANVARGPAKGGIRIASSVTLEETRDLAERMVWKTALSGIPFGGGKSGICLNPKEISKFEKIAVMKEFVHMISLELMSGTYIPAPDLGTDPHDMAVVYGETHILESVTGKPPRVGGLPGRKEATGRGVAHATELALTKLLRKKLAGATIAVQGFGNVGSWTCYFLQKAGAKVVAVSNEHGGIYDKKGLDIEAMMKHVQTSPRLGEFGGDTITNEEVLELKVDALIPAAIENQITKDNANAIQAKVIVEGANGPTTKEADAILADRGILVIPDILANCGGVVASYVEWRKAKSGSITEAKETYQTLMDRIDIAFENVTSLAKKEKVAHRTAAEIIAVSEVIDAMKDRGWV
ncbi:MAG: Glu/Leu/Phe/Val dehydrogenase [Planctomycetota bacterium]